MLQISSSSALTLRAARQRQPKRLSLVHSFLREPVLPQDLPVRVALENQADAIDHLLDVRAAASEIRAQIGEHGRFLLDPV